MVKLYKQFEEKETKPFVTFVIVLCVLLLTMFILMDELILTIVTLTLIVTIMTSYWILTYTASKIEASLHLRQSRLYPGEETDLELSLINRSLFPLFSATVQLDWPYEKEALGVVKEGNIEQTLPHLFQQGYSVRQREKIVHKEKLRAKKRGVVQLHQVHLKVSDWLGLFAFRVEMKPELPITVIIYPTFTNGYNLNKSLRTIEGESKKKGENTEDIMGVRPYQWGDRLRNIDWKSLAKHQQLMTREYADPLYFKATVILSLHEGEDENRWSEKPEEVIRKAANVCYALSTSHQSFEVYINDRSGRNSTGIYLPPGQGRAQLQRVLHVLAYLKIGSPLYPVSYILHGLSQKRDPMSYVIYVGDRSGSGTQLLSRLGNRDIVG
ncbi:hypothetical protein CR194_05025 [Salipaludibacillus keqinensis]|uniref:DUF58 domain-containing protein n=1 Tax=Salipaludibacillus keqinensis TaxID=2045207 RepID=A0A323TJ81_9BACI|nr:DUF58 domain-containing protein [Salipaludibacillus keqinensis]PYZ94888.1 hypothetical protein CR194_05025 [Salipaludibacillus keqinensis]